jgi:hypothetical protein
MTDKTISINRKVNGNYFNLQYRRSSKLKLDYFTNQFIFNDYWCYKSTDHQKYISNEEDFQDFKYSVYTFFKKELYSKDYIDIWIKYITNIGGIKYIIKPLPPFDPYKKIKIMK